MDATEVSYVCPRSHRSVRKATAFVTAPDEVQRVPTERVYAS